MTKEVPRTSVLRDAELIARLRSVWRYKDLHLCPEAADRIEALIAETNEFCDELAVHAEKLAHAEAKLAKAVEALGRISDGENWQANEARAALAEIKGESHE